MKQAEVENGIKTQIFLLGWACISLCWITYTTAFSHGASLAACSDMRPKHIRAQPQNPRKNYITIYTNRSFYLPGDTVPVTVRSSRDFMGFMLQARRVSNDQVAGSFVLIPHGSKLLRCFEDGDTVTHSDKSLKRNLSFVWKSPDQPVGDIKFFLSVVQSYFVYWARLESSTVSAQIDNRTFTSTATSEFQTISPTTPQASLKAEQSTLKLMPVPGLMPTNTMVININSSTASPVGTESQFPRALGGLTTLIQSLLNIMPESVTPSSNRNTAETGTMKPSLQSDVPTAVLLGLLSQTVVYNVSMHEQFLELCLIRNITEMPGFGVNDLRTTQDLRILQSTPESSTSPPCTTSVPVTEVISAGFTPSSTRPTLPPDPQMQTPAPVLPTEEIFHYPVRSNLQETQSSKFQTFTARDKEQAVTKKMSANFLHQPTSYKNTEVVDGVTSAGVTRSVQEIVVPSKGGENRNKGMNLAMTQLGILLGCSAILGMALAAGLRCIHAQYCHKRTEVSFSEPDDNVITVRENGEMMHFKKIRENSFVLVQAEYNWITPSNNGKTQ
ncbi:reelin domain-containing protein 1 [Discoglossus pictus]